MRAVAAAVLADRELERADHDRAEAGEQRRGLPAGEADDRADRADENQQLGERPWVPRRLGALPHAAGIAVDTAVGRPAAGAPLPRRSAPGGGCRRAGPPPPRSRPARPAPPPRTPL